MLYHRQRRMHSAPKRCRPRIPTHRCLGVRHRRRWHRLRDGISQKFKNLWNSRSLVVTPINDTDFTSYTCIATNKQITTLLVAHGPTGRLILHCFKAEDTQSLVCKKTPKPIKKLGRTHLPPHQTRTRSSFSHYHPVAFAHQNASRSLHFLCLEVPLEA